MRCQLYRSGECREVAPGDLERVLAEPGAFVWCDVADPAPEDLAPLQERFALHPLAVEDALHAHQRPKIEAYGEGETAYWFVVAHPATLTDDDLTIHEVAIFVGRRFLITVRARPAYPMADVRQRWLAHAGRAGGESGSLLYTLLDAIVDGYFPVAEWFEERVDAIETQLFDGRRGHEGLSRPIFQLKKDSQRFRRAAWPMRDILAPLVRGDLPVFAEAQLAYFRDVYDHAMRVVDQVDATRDLANSALDVQLAVTANRQNEVTKQLTIIATIFLPLSFITGFFGQNFAFLIGYLAGPAAFWTLGVTSELVVIGLMVLFFRVRGWF
jgi:magnesium transporter